MEDGTSSTCSEPQNNDTHHTVMERTRGIVTGHRSHRHVRSVLVYPVVRYETVTGEEIEFESPLGSNAPPEVGEEVEVVYDPENPQEATIPASAALRYGLTPFYVAGGFILIVGGTMLLAVLGFAALMLLMVLAG